MDESGLKALEDRIAQEEATLARLTAALRQQQERIALLRHELEQLREELAAEAAAEQAKGQVLLPL